MLTKPRMRVLDPFMGSGTVGEACAQLDRTFIGIEIDPVYFAISKKRVEIAYDGMDTWTLANDAPPPPRRLRG